jgi:hypothetical protein
MKLKIFCRCRLFSFLAGLRTYQHPCTTISCSNSYEQKQRNVAEEGVLELVLQCEHL